MRGSLSLLLFSLVSSVYSVLIYSISRQGLVNIPTSFLRPTKSHLSRPHPVVNQKLSFTSETLQRHNDKEVNQALCSIFIFLTRSELIITLKAHGKRRIVMCSVFE